MSEHEVLDLEAITPAQSSMVDEFVAVTGESSDVAQRILESCTWNLQMALNMHMDGQDAEPMVTNNLNQPASSLMEDEVRAPIPPVRQVLIHSGDPTHYETTRRSGRGNMASNFEAFRDFRAEAEFLQSTSNGDAAKIRSLEDLFRPPLDLMFRGTWELLREEGVKNNKWLMVNVQDSKEFSCQILNRDVWSNTAVKDIVSEHFLFWQVMNTSREGERYLQFYNVFKYPYISILDPRTGERVRFWNNITDPNIFCETITDFLSEHPSPDGSLPSACLARNILEPQPVAGAEVPPANSIYDADEEAQLAAAIKASLEPTKSRQIVPIAIDSDSDSSSIESFVSGANSPAQESSPEVQIINGSEDYQEFLGSQDGEKTDIILRYPDGEKEKMTFPTDSKIKALFLYIKSKGYGLDKYDLVTNFPRRNIHDLPPSQTLSESNILREQLYIHHKTS